MNWNRKKHKPDPLKSVDEKGRPVNIQTGGSAEFFRLCARTDLTVHGLKQGRRNGEWVFGVTYKD